MGLQNRKAGGTASGSFFPQTGPRRDQIPNIVLLYPSNFLPRPLVPSLPAGGRTESRACYCRAICRRKSRTANTLIAAA